MSTIVVICPECGVEFEPGRDAILAGAWRTCPECQARVRGTRPETPTEQQDHAEVMRIRAQSPHGPRS